MNKLQHSIQSLRQPYRWLFAFGLFIIILIIINGIHKYFDPEVALISAPMFFAGAAVATLMSVRYFQTDRGKSIFFLSIGGLLAVGLIVLLIVVPLAEQDLPLTSFSGILAVIAIVWGIALQIKMRKG